jgi:ABC-2 type transport system permease protein
MSVPRIASRRVWTMSRAELQLLWRNKTALFTALAMPFLIMLILSSLDSDGRGSGPPGDFMATGTIGFALLLVVYYNLVSTYAARREELVLKRLRTSEASDTEILLGAAVPALLLAGAWSVLSVAGAMALLGLGLPVNPVLLVAGVLGGAAVFALLAAATSGVTKSSEMAQLTTLPMLVVAMIGSGLAFPVDLLPDVLSGAVRLLPLTPAVDLIHLGLSGTTGAAEPVGFIASFGKALVPAALTLVWIYLGVYATRRWFRWEPRA